MIYAYVPVSTDGQSVEAQIPQLRAAGAAKVFREVASGAKTDWAIAHAGPVDPDHPAGPPLALAKA